MELEITIVMDWIIRIIGIITIIRNIIVLIKNDSIFENDIKIIYDPCEFILNRFSSLSRI